MKHIDLVAAARPNFMKIAPLWHALRTKEGYAPRIVHTGQHYDHAMSTIFFEELGMPKPHVNLGIGSGTHGQQTGRVLEAYEQLLLTQQRPDLVIVVGDVNATPAAALAAVKLGIPVAHLEAGLRSFDRTMPEEINRILTDAICDRLWTPSPDADEHLKHEGIPGKRIARVGNIMIDTLEMLLPAIRQNNILEDIGLQETRYTVVTLHRPSNVDTPERLSPLCKYLRKCADILPVVFPVHPRTRASLERFQLLDTLKEHPAITLLPPQPYCAFLRLVSASRAVITDSGGIQEETSYLGIPCLTLRENTERPVTITLGTNRLTSPANVVELLETVLQEEGRRPVIPLWDGQTAQRIVEDLQNNI